LTFQVAMRTEPTVPVHSPLLLSDGCDRSPRLMADPRNERVVRVGSQRSSAGLAIGARRALWCVAGGTAPWVRTLR
jgi:hypothetical protein